MSKKTDKTILRAARRHSLLAYIMSAVQSGDISEFSMFNEMLPVIEKDLGELPGLVKLDKKTERLLSWIGEATVCRGCGKKIYWILTKNNKKMPIDPDGESHHATCSKVKMFRKKKRKK